MHANDIIKTSATKYTAYGGVRGGGRVEALRTNCGITYHCRDCGKEGFLPVVYGDEGYTTEHCPFCDSDRVEWGYECPLCGRFTTDAYCGDCENNLRERFRELLICNFTQEEIKALNEIFDGKDLE